MPPMNGATDFVSKFDWRACAKSVAESVLFVSSSCLITAICVGGLIEGNVENASLAKAFVLFVRVSSSYRESYIGVR